MRHEVILCVRSAHHEREESLSAGVPLKGPGSSRVLDALWCNLGLIFKHFFSILMATILLEKWLIPIMICFSDPHPLPRPCFRANRKTVANCTSQVRSAKSLSAGGRGPLKDNMEYLGHDYMLPWTALFHVYPVTNEVVVLIKIVQKNFNESWQRCYRKTTFWQNTDTERHMWDSGNCVISAEWRTQKLWSCFSFKFQKY